MRGFYAIIALAMLLASHASAAGPRKPRQAPPPPQAPACVSGCAEAVRSVVSAVAAPVSGKRKTADCSDQCTCGCNDGLPCSCGNEVRQAAPVMTEIEPEHTGRRFFVQPRRGSGFRAGGSC